VRKFFPIPSGDNRSPCQKIFQLTASQYIIAGAVVPGIGSELIPYDAIRGRQVERIAELACRFVDSSRMAGVDTVSGDHGSETFDAERADVGLPPSCAHGTTFTKSQRSFQAVMNLGRRQCSRKCHHVCCAASSIRSGHGPARSFTRPDQQIVSCCGPSVGPKRWSQSVRQSASPPVGIRFRSADYE